MITWTRSFVYPRAQTMKLLIKHELLPKDSTVIVGVSGGRDSMALVHALLKQRPDLRIIAAHINHGLRTSSKDDAEFVEGMMKRWEVECELFSPRKPKTGNTEAWGREKRYEFFEKLRKKYRSEWVLTAHHQDDDFESMLMAFMRGTRVKGMSGMLEHRQNIYRPLLFTPRKDINEYVEYYEIHFKNDPTNEDNSITRNFLRNQVIPVLNHMYPEMASKWQRQKNYWLELQDLLETTAEVFMDEFIDPTEGLLKEAYKALPYPIRATVLELWYQESTGKRVPDSVTLERWDHAILNFDSRKKTEWDEKRFLVINKKRAKIA